MSDDDPLYDSVASDDDYAQVPSEDGDEEHQVKDQNQNQIKDGGSKTAEKSLR